jgi:mannose/cellobiose epimerase-like protein (N-acyl-D-glucosamine 2-epimerase family)
MNYQFTSETGLRSASRKAIEWMFDSALPLWSRNGIDQVFGGFHDSLDMETGSCVTPTKRSFVQARQIYVFAESAKLGWPGPWQAALENGLATLEDSCRHDEWGYINTIGSNNKKLQTKRDLYDQAFVAFAKSCVAFAIRDNDIASRGHIADARNLLESVEKNWAAPSGGFYEGELHPKLPRKQNPHMHLLEAYIALAIATGDAADVVRANSIANFAVKKIIDSDYHVIPEYFTEHWDPVSTNGQFSVEPGHHFEWVWLLCRLANIGGVDHRPLAKKLWHFACDYGIDERRGVAIDEVSQNGLVISSRARLWPQTERLKAALAMMEFGVSDARDEAEKSFAGLNKYLQTPVHGLYYDKLLDDGSFVNEPARASSLYHIVCAFSELERVVSLDL